MNFEYVNFLISSWTLAVVLSSSTVKTEKKTRARKNKLVSNGDQKFEKKTNWSEIANHVGKSIKHQTKIALNIL